MKTTNRILIGLGIIAIIGLSTWSIRDLIQRSHAKEDVRSSVTRPKKTGFRPEHRDDDFGDRIRGTVVSADATVITLEADFEQGASVAGAQTTSVTPVSTDATTGSTKAGGNPPVDRPSGNLENRILQISFSLSPEVTIVDEDGKTYQRVNPGDRVELSFDDREVIRILILKPTANS